MLVEIYLCYKNERLLKGVSDYLFVGCFMPRQHANVSQEWDLLR